MNTSQPLWFYPKLLKSVTEYFKTRCLFTAFGNVTNSTGLVSPTSSIGIAFIMKKKNSQKFCSLLRKGQTVLSVSTCRLVETGCS